MKRMDNASEDIYFVLKGFPPVWVMLVNHIFSYLNINFCQELKKKMYCGGMLLTYISNKRYAGFCLRHLFQSVVEVEFNRDQCIKLCTLRDYSGRRKNAVF